MLLASAIYLELRFEYSDLSQDHNYDKAIREILAVDHIRLVTAKPIAKASKSENLVISLRDLVQAT